MTIPTSCPNVPLGSAIVHVVAGVARYAAVGRPKRVLDTTVDYLMDGSADDTAVVTGLERELVARLQQVQYRPPKEKRTVLSLFDAFVTKSKIQGLLTG